MNLLTLLPDVSGAAWLPLADAVMKASLLLGSAALASVALRRASAAARHLVWTLALVSAMVLPALSIALPRWQLPLVTLQSAAVTPDVPATGDAPPVAPALRARRAPAQPDTVVAPVATSFVMPLVSIGAALLLVWAFGAVLILGRLAMGVFAVQWMSGRTKRVTNATWLPLARELAAKLAVSPRIAFLRSGCAAMPMAWGIFRPSVVMPADADTWPAERLRIVLLHELAHVKRRDCLTHMLAQMTCALYWFNPLAWMAARHLRTERERACDDLVLEAGTRGAEYADQLLEIARVMRAGRFPGVLGGASLAMAHRSQLEGRLIAILDPTVPRSGMSRLRTAGATLVFACAVMPLASVQPWTYAAERQVSDLRLKAEATPGAAQAPEVRVSTHVTTRTQTETQVIDKTALGDSVQGAIADSASGIVEGVIQGIVQPTIATVLESLGAIGQDTNLKQDKIAKDDSGKSKADPRMVAALTAALKDTDKDVREQAAFALGQIRDRSAVDALVIALKDSDAGVREQVAFALGQLHDKTAASALAGALKDVDEDVREQVVFALGQLRDVASVDGLAAALHDAKPDVREQAAFALGQIRDRSAVDALVIALKDADPDVREQAAFALGQIGDPRAIDGLTAALKDSSADVRQQAAFALGRCIGR